MPNLGVFDAWHFPMIQWSNMIQFCAESGRLHQCQVILLRLWRCGCSRKNHSDGPVVDGTGMYWLKLMFDISGLFSSLSVHKEWAHPAQKHTFRERNWYELMLCPTDSCTSNSLRENSNHLKAMSQLQITCHYWWCV
jgi:hypothetical protein